MAKEEEKKQTEPNLEKLKALQATISKDRKSVV